MVWLRRINIPQRTASMERLLFHLMFCFCFHNLCVSTTTDSSPTDVKVGVIMNDIGFILDTYHFKPAVDIAVDTVNKGVQTGKYLNFTLSYVYGVTDSTCGNPIMSAGGVASDMYTNHKVVGFFGPLCSPETEPVGDLGNYWNLPVVSGVSTAGYLDDKSRHRTLTRTSYKASNIADFMAEVFLQYNWKRCSIIWDESLSYWRTVMKPSLDISFSVSDIDHYDFILKDYDSSKEALEAAVTKGRSKFMYIFIC